MCQLKKIIHKHKLHIQKCRVLYKVTHNLVIQSKFYLEELIYQNLILLLA